MLPITERILAPGVTLRAVKTKKFKTSLLGVTFLTALTEETASLNALLPKVLRRGTRTCPDMEALSAALDELYGGSVEPVVRKKGEVQCVGFVGSFLDDAFVPPGTRLLEPAAALLGQLVLEPAGSGDAFLEEYVESEKENLLDKIRGEINDRLQYAMSRLRETMCAGETYGVSRLGSLDRAREVTGSALFSQYKTLLASAPIYLYYCGSADIDRVEAAFRAAFAGLPQGDRHRVPPTRLVKEPGGPVRRVSEAMDVTQGKLVLGFRTGKSYRTLEEVAQATLFSAVYGGSTNSKLFLNVREKLSLCYFASASLAMTKGIMLVYSGVEFANFRRAEEEILAQLEACRAGEIGAQELEAARLSAVSAFRTTLDSQSRLEEFWLNRFFTGTDFPPEALAEAIGRVSLDQVVEVARRIRLDTIFTLEGKEA